MKNPTLPKYEFAQPYGTYRLGYVASRQKTQVQLTPGYYSLSTLSEVPYVSLVGNLGQEKTATWGEIFYINDGSNAIVINSSFHPGNIVLNGGHDFSAKPGRLTVPTRFTLTGVNTYTTSITPDTRGAKRGWLFCNTTAGAACVARKVGKAIERSHDTFDSVSPGPGYTFDESIAPGSQILQIAIGPSTVGVNNDPMGLLDTAQITLVNVTVDPGTASAYYVLEY